jgi:hypothetical protein
VVLLLLATLASLTSGLTAQFAGNLRSRRAA